jgi:hypothetical protein
MPKLSLYSLLRLSIIRHHRCKSIIIPRRVKATEAHWFTLTIGNRAEQMWGSWKFLATADRQMNLGHARPWRDRYVPSVRVLSEVTFPVTLFMVFVLFCTDWIGSEVNNFISLPTIWLSDTLALHHTVPLITLGECELYQVWLTFAECLAPLTQWHLPGRYNLQRVLITHNGCTMRHAMMRKP